MARVLFVITAQYVLALLAYAVGRIRSRRIGYYMVVAAGVAIPLMVLVLPSEATITRFLLAVLGMLWAGRAYSVWQEAPGVALGNYVHFLSVGLLRPHLVYAPATCVRPKHIAREITRAILAAAVIPIAWKLGETLILTPASEESWLLNHLIVLAAVIVIVGAIGQALLAVWRLQGIPARRPINDAILLSRTPADFWRRWSWPIHAWLRQYAYLPAGGTRHHVRATLWVFLVSGLCHELLFFLVTGRVRGHQTLFFMISALGVLASPALERFARRRGIAGEVLVRAATITFLAATAALMFASLNYVTPIYVKRIWLIW